MDESQLAGALAFCRLVLNQPELRIDDICKANVVNRIIADFDKRPTVKQCEPNPNVSFPLIPSYFGGLNIIFSESDNQSISVPSVTTSGKLPMPTLPQLM